MSGGMKIKDHAFFGGSGSPRFPTGNKLRAESSAEGAGGLGTYEDTTEKIKSQQEMSIRKAKSHGMKPSHRN